MHCSHSLMFFPGNYELIIFSLPDFLIYLQGKVTALEMVPKIITSKPKTSSSSVDSDETDLYKPLNFDDDFESSLTNFSTQSEFKLFIALS